MTEDDLNELDEHARSFLPSRGLVLLARLRADLARVTAERDEWRELALHAEAVGIERAATIALLESRLPDGDCGPDCYGKDEHGGACRLARRDP